MYTEDVLYLFNNECLLLVYRIAVQTSTIKALGGFIAFSEYNRSQNLSVLILF